MKRFPLPLRMGSALALVAVGVLAGACSSSSDNSAAAQEWVAKYCDLLMPCCTKYGLASDGRQCRSLFGSLTVGYDATAGDACLREMRAAQANPDFCGGGGGNKLAPSCEKVFPRSSGGTKKPGDACSTDSECATSAQGRVSCASKTETGGARTSVCQVAIAGKEGDGPCSGTVDGNVTFGSGYSPSPPPSQTFVCEVKDGVDCPSTLSSTDPPPKCVRIGEIGSPCTSSFGSNSCVKAAYCDSADKTCKARIAVGEACFKFSSDCAIGAYCDDTTLKCTPAVAEGAACTTSEQCLSRNCDNKKCAKAGDLSALGYLLICGGPASASGG